MQTECSTTCLNVAYIEGSRTGPDARAALKLPVDKAFPPDLPGRTYPSIPFCAHRFARSRSQARPQPALPSRDI